VRDVPRLRDVRRQGHDLGPEHALGAALPALRRDGLGAGAMTEFLIGIILFLGFLAALGLLADWIDGTDRRDARRRNHARRVR
jgi:hypothetical protein